MAFTANILTAAGSNFTRIGNYDFLAQGPGTVDPGATTTAYVANFGTAKISCHRHWLPVRQRIADGRVDLVVHYQSQRGVDRERHL